MLLVNTGHTDILSSRPNIPDLTPTTNLLAKRVDALATLWESIPNKVSVGNHKNFVFSEYKQNSFSTAEFYGCTVVIIVDGLQTYIGHFAQAQGNCAEILGDKTKTQKTIIDEMVNDLILFDFQAGAKAWIVQAMPNSINGKPLNAPGYDELVKNLGDYVQSANIQPIAYSAGSGDGGFPGSARGKAVVERDTDAGGSTIKVYIQQDNPTWTGNFDAQCNPRRKGKRDGSGCIPISKAGSASPPGPTPSCTYVGPSPPQQPKASCDCNGKTGFPLTTLSQNLAPESSCAWSTLPGTTTAPSNPLGPPTTNSKACQVCTRDTVNEDNCQSIPNCIKEPAQATVQAGSSPVHVGTLTDKALSTAISSALDKACPSVTQNSVTACQTGGVTINKIDYKDFSNVLKHDGTIEVKVEASSYNSSAIRKAMIDSAALTAMHGATGKNCYQDSLYIENGKFKRTYDAFRDSLDSFLPRSLHRRDGGPAQPIPEQVTWCNTVSFAGVQYFGEFARLASTLGATDYLDAHWDFHVSSGDTFDCAFLGELIDAFAVVAPEFAEADIALGETIKATW